MKEGASDPFAEAESDTESGTDPEPEDPDAAGTTDAAASRSTAASEPSDPAADRSGPSRDPERAPAADESAREPDADTREDRTAGGRDGGEVSVSREDLPYVLARDNVKDQRPSVHQLFVQAETDRAAKDAERELENALDEDVYRLDAREAIYLAGIRNLDDAAAVLRRWGYDL